MNEEWPNPKPLYNDGDMDPIDAIKNRHINNAGNRANAAIELLHGREVLEKEILPLEGAPGGYESMFKEPPTPARITWVALVTGFVNGWDTEMLRRSPEERKHLATHARERLRRSESELLRSLVKQPSPMEIN